MSIQTIETMAKWVENHITEEINLEKASSHVGYSRFYCSAKFKEYMGMTFKQFVATSKLKAATQDLSHTNDKITHIALRYGYASSEAFARAFSKVFHCSPREYRKQTRDHQ